MMLKVITPGAQDFSEPVAQLVKISSRGLLGFDRSQFIKRAGAEFAHELDQIKFAADEIPVHLLAVGTTEDYGSNRNGDGFTRRTCSRRHNTFEKYARFYRDHENKDPAKSYGFVKRSAYHEPMKRIELLCALNATQAAADRNGGFVADQEREKLAKDLDIAVSMACRVPNDVCSYCGNIARTRREYCTDTDEGGLCKAGGLKRNIGRLLDNGHVLHADNPEPTFFDISHVFRPADRIAYVMGQLEKAASNGHIMSGAEIAEAIGLTAPYTLFVTPGLLPDVLRQVKLAFQLANLESSLVMDSLALGFTKSVQPAKIMPADSREKFAHFLKALADERICLPVRDFVRLATDLEEKQANDVAQLVSLQLPGIYGRLTALPDFEQLIRGNPYTPATSATPDLAYWATKCAADLSLAEPFVMQRVQLAAIRQTSMPRMPSNGHTKLASAGGPSAKLAEHYALYKLAFLSSIPDTETDLPLTSKLALLQNYVQ